MLNLNKMAGGTQRLLMRFWLKMLNSDHRKTPTKRPGPSVKDDIKGLAWGAQLNWSVVLGLFFIFVNGMSNFILVFHLRHAEHRNVHFWVNVYVIIIWFWFIVIKIIRTDIHVVVQGLLWERIPRRPPFGQDFLRPLKTSFTKRPFSHNFLRPWEVLQSPSGSFHPVEWDSDSGGGHKGQTEH